MMKKEAVVLLSGGLDSATVLAIAQAEGFNVRALSFRYGQRHYNELDAARRVAKAAGVGHHLIASVDQLVVGSSALTGQGDVPKERDTAAMSSDIPPTYVPGRNTIFIAYALAWAEVVWATDVFIGVNAVDYSGYPDCRPEYVDAYQRLANVSSKAAIEGAPVTLRAPLINDTKADIIARGLALGVDYSITHSCYDPVNGVACGRCDSCKLRLAGFSEVGIADPAPYCVTVERG